MSGIETSKTHRLYLLLKEQIASGALVAGQKLPSEPQLARLHGLSRVTVRRALEGLLRDGLIRKTPGAGSFVNAPSSPAPVTGDLTDMLASLTAMGRSSTVRLLDFRYSVPPPHVADKLRLPQGARAQHALRVRMAAGVPFSLLSTYVPESIGRKYSRRDLSVTPLLELLERSGVIADRAEQTVTAVLAGPEAAQALGVQVGAALLALTRVVFDPAGHGVEYLSALYRPDMHSIRMELMRAGQGRERYWLTTRPGNRSKEPRHTSRKQRKSLKPNRRDAA
ncbi:MAG TPA: GntR family transcriptional regulator [Hyphomicrobiaceae bacterium]|nr:GntR family transcriptional regulator [Hyphomicrobiaceae bacterium]